MLDEVEDDHDDHSAHLQPGGSWLGLSFDLGADGNLSRPWLLCIPQSQPWGWFAQPELVGNDNVSWHCIAFVKCKYFQFVLPFACSAVFVTIIVEILSIVLRLLLLSILWTIFMTHDIRMFHKRLLKISSTRWRFSGVSTRWADD